MFRRHLQTFSSIQLALPPAGIFPYLYCFIFAAHALITHAEVPMRLLAIYASMVLTGCCGHSNH